MEDKIKEILNESDFIRSHRSADCVVVCCYCNADGSYYDNKDEPVTHKDDCIVTKLRQLIKEKK